MDTKRQTEVEFSTYAWKDPRKTRSHCHPNNKEALQVLCGLWVHFASQELVADSLQCSAPSSLQGQICDYIRVGTLRRSRMWTQVQQSGEDYA